MDRFIILSGCSGGGKSTLLAELARRGFATVEEPGRRIVLEETRNGGTALPWIDIEAFARRAIAMALEDRQNAPQEGPVFFDRSLVDAASALRHVSGDTFIETLRHAHRYNRLVFLTPPWPEIYRGDDERRHDFDAAVEEYQRLLRDYDALGYDIDVLPKSSVQERADFILARIG
ncbi:MULTISPECIES: AAA family ATPase [unclassified Agrobacterium]|uniref:AAA family ATPase n=1 Tax=unclassified Agrobacterium TaxID=2632611 RepID=UPI00244C77A9|nr:MULTISPECIES: AAA family ATPase [unclassified Agrobacterium]MDH0615808.1 AAA family ATPase [Agrobacterium sp. GD03872]MDH0697839.1 AAA family ATPase [Agrobacterium sp. GD03871]MDH1062662.1 AAA family ATPase [Agrobacterium sp. GD03992]MDH2211200.1 AAA family ATPase [Agrobacterium sp. GD03643]MDH2222854.1 AAA family ATPase [Agrobacterium sp. GD03638]